MRNARGHYWRNSGHRVSVSSAKLWGHNATVDVREVKRNKTNGLQEVHASVY